LPTTWEKVLKKTQWQPENYGYYNCLPVKPGVFIYKALCDSGGDLKQLKMNIPETLCSFEGVFWITRSKPFVFIS